MKKQHNITPIYALCDYQSLLKFDVSLDDFINASNKYNLTYIHYKDTINSLDIQKRHLNFLKNNTHIPIIINDINLLKYADGINISTNYLTQLQSQFKINNTQLFLKFIKQKYKNIIIGLSTNNELEILEANKFNLDYIVLDISNSSDDKITYLSKISKHQIAIIQQLKFNTESSL